MRLRVTGLDPSLTAWGIASGELDLVTGYLENPLLEVIEPDGLQGKQIRVNSQDLFKAEQLARAVFNRAEAAEVVFVETPVGSQSARAMASYGICVGILGALRAKGVQLVEVTAIEVKLSLSGKRHATKEQMIAAALAQYPTAIFPTHRGKITAKAEHVADALGAIHAGVNTPLFQNLMRLHRRNAA
jgi:hypothetical protein